MEKSNEEIDMMTAMLDDDFQAILQQDPVLDELEKSKYDPKTAYFELMMSLSKIFTIDGVTVSCITPAVWAYLYAIGSPYTQGGEISQLDTDIVLYILHNGIKQVDRNLVTQASGFCERHGINLDTAESDVQNLIYLSFRPLEMLPSATGSTEKPRYDLDWLTHLVSVVAPLTNKTADQIMYDMSLCECYYYCIQQARQFDTKREIRRRDSAEITQAIYERTLALGKEYWQEHYASDAVDESAKNKDSVQKSE